MKQSLPLIANNRPAKAELIQGEQYYYCTCGRSASQPLCDGSHAGTSFTPMEFTAEKEGAAYLCACKHTENAPYCDGSHKSIPAEQVGKVAP